MSKVFVYVWSGDSILYSGDLLNYKAPEEYSDACNCFYTIFNEYIPVHVMGIYNRTISCITEQMIHLQREIIDEQCHTVSTT